MKSTKFILTSAVALTLLSGASFGAENEGVDRTPSDRGAPRDGGGIDGRGAKRGGPPNGAPGPQQGGGPGIGAWGGRRWGALPSEEEWKQVETFAEANSPRRLAALSKLRDATDPAYRGGQMFLTVRYRALQQMKEHDPDLYAERLKAMVVEDKVFGAVEDGHAKPEATADQRDALLADVKQLVAFNLKEREQRLERLAKVLDDERKKLTDDQAREDELADQKMDEIEREGVKALQLEGRGGPGRRDGVGRENGGRDGGPPGDRGPRPEGDGPPGPPR